MKHDKFWCGHIGRKGLPQMESLTILTSQAKQI